MTSIGLTSFQPQSWPLQYVCETPAPLPLSSHPNPGRWGYRSYLVDCFVGTISGFFRCRPERLQSWLFPYFGNARSGQLRRPNRFSHGPRFDCCPRSPWVDWLRHQNCVCGDNYLGTGQYPQPEVSPTSPAWHALVRYLSLAFSSPLSRLLSF